ncbi:MAG TPA: F420-nonreducing hydrogenase [bacterium]|nr:F420-nonreducing hydrogenase [bacterium]
MPDKVTVATTWLQGCSGCHIALFDLDEELLDVLEIIDLKAAPVMDVKQLPDVDIGLVEGCVANDDNEEVLKHMREKSKKLVALGTCACFGGICGLRNLYHLHDVLERGYVTTESTVDGHIPQSADIPKLKEYVRPIDQVVKVDGYIPGCPPLPELIKEGLLALTRGELPEIKTRNLCEECTRKKSKMLTATRDYLTAAVCSPNELEEIDPHVCFLEQGVLCMGPATREGCDARCLHGNMPCRGCMGPTPDAQEQGAKMINALSSILPAGALMFQEDVVGVGYRYSMPVSIFPHLSNKKKE